MSIASAVYVLIYLVVLLSSRAVAATATAAPHDQIHSLPVGWRHIGCPPDDETLRLQVSLMQQNVPLIESTLRQVADPDSPCYGHYLSRDEVDDLFKPSDKATEAVRSWLIESGIAARDIETDVDNHHVSFSTSVQRANKIFNTTFLTYANGDVRKTRTTHYYIPDHLSDHVHFVTPTTYFDNITPRRRSQKAQKRSSSAVHQDLESCQTSWTPACLRDIYNVGDYAADPDSGSRVSWATYFNDTALYRDVELYEHLHGLPLRNFSIELVSGGTASQDPELTDFHHPDLDAFGIIAVTGGQLPVMQYSVGGPPPPYIPNADGPDPLTDENEPYLSLYQHMLSKTNDQLPQVLTTSYSDDEQTVPRQYAERVCNMIGMLGLRGVTVIQTMAGRGPGTACLSNDGHNRPEFTPQFPSSCPYITTVGEVNQTNPLTTWNISSGGFSFYFDRPWYQRDAVQTYLDHRISPETRAYYAPFFNQQGRGSPDLSLQGYKPDDPGDFNVEPIAPSGGTRGNAVWAGLVGLLNDARLRAHMPPMGFINPWLYKVGALGLVDVVLGGSIGCVGSNIQFHRVIPQAHLIPWVGWNATEGWDPATGLGFPDFQKLRRLALDMKKDVDQCPYDWWKV